jgi:hypothetical protein
MIHHASPKLKHMLTDMVARPSRVWTVLLTAALLLAFLTSGGCSPPQASPDNRHLISSLRTAISAENEQWLAENEEVIQQRFDQGAMEEDEYEVFREIIARAKSGQWDAAEQQVVRFQKAQYTDG